MICVSYFAKKALIAFIFLGSHAALAFDGPGGKKGFGPIDQIKLEAVDESLAAKGKDTFMLKCSACHKINEKVVGPALYGITKRREPEWIMNMILNPDEMIKKDPTAKELFETMLIPMTFQQVSKDEARMMLEYFRSVDSKPAAQVDNTNQNTNTNTKTTKRPQPKKK